MHVNIRGNNRARCAIWKGPVNSLGVYFRCRADGEVKAVGDDALGARWIAIEELRYLARSSQRSSRGWIWLASSTTSPVWNKR